MPRDEKVIIRLHTDIKNEFQEVAEKYGMTLSALGAYVIGKYLEDRQKAERFTSDMIMPATQKMSEQFFNDDDRFKQMLTQVIQEFKEQPNRS